MIKVPDTSSHNLGFRVASNFWLNEFRCRCFKDAKQKPLDEFCGGAVLLHPLLVGILQYIRDAKGAVVIESAYRCPAYHKYIYSQINMRRIRGGALPMPIPKDSAHLHGQAADVWIHLAKDDEGWLKNLGVTGIGYNLGKQQNKTHLDIYHETFTTWNYEKIK